MAKESKVAIYPGSFDPLTNGHIDIIERGRTIFDKIIIAVLHNPSKKALFSVEERIEMIQQTFKGIDFIEVDSFDGLLVEYAKIRGAMAILRGMRAISDFENEFQMALMNRRLSKEVHTIFFMTGLRWIFTSSSIIKEVALFGGDITSMVSDPVKLKLKEKFEKLKKKKYKNNNKLDN